MSPVRPLMNEWRGLDPIASYLRDETVTEVMVNGPDRVYVERDGRLEQVDSVFRDVEHLEDAIQRIVAPLGRRIDPSAPFVDARLPDGSRVHAIIPPLAVFGPYLTLRKFRSLLFAPAELVRNGTCGLEMMSFLEDAVKSRCSLLISGGAGSGKTTLLNALSSFINDGERLITLEDAAELRLQQPHVLSLEARPENLEGKGEVTLRTLLRNALRMRPDRIILGEVRGSEAFDLLQALNTGHEGGLATIHANSPRDALRRLANLALMAGEALPYPAICDQIAAGVDLVVQLSRLRDGSRRVTRIGLVAPRAEGLEAGREGLAVRELFSFRGEGLDHRGRVAGEFIRHPEPLSPGIQRKFHAAGLHDH